MICTTLKRIAVTALLLVPVLRATAALAVPCSNQLVTGTMPLTTNYETMGTCFILTSTSVQINMQNHIITCINPSGCGTAIVGAGTGGSTKNIYNGYILDGGSQAMPGCSLPGCRFQTAVSNVHQVDLLVTNNTSSYGIASTAVVTNSNVSNTGNSAITGASNVNNNYINNVAGNGIMLASNGTASSNTISHVSGGAIVGGTTANNNTILDAFAGIQDTSTTVSGNVITASDNGISVQSLAVTGSIDNNFISDVTQIGIYANGSAGPTNQPVVEKNYVRNAPAGMYSLPGGTTYLKVRKNIMDNAPMALCSGFPCANKTFTCNQCDQTTTYCPILPAPFNLFNATCP